MKELTKAEKDEEADIKKIIYSFEPLIEKAKNRDALKATPRFRRFRRRWRRLRRSVRRRWRRARRSIRDSIQEKKWLENCLKIVLFYCIANLSQKFSRLIS